MLRFIRILRNLKMNFFYRFNEILKDYFKNKKTIVLTFTTIFILFFIQFFAQIMPYQMVKVIIFDIITPLIIYLSMISVLILLTGKFSEYKFKEKLFRTLKEGWWIIALKMFWNVCNVIIMGIDYSPDENSSIIPFFILIFVWFTILLFGSYAFPIIISDAKRKPVIGLKSFLGYFNNYFGEIFLGIFLSIFFSGIFLFFSSFMFSYISKIMDIFLDPFFVKIFIEDFLSISTQVIYAHFLAINSIRIFKKI